MSNTTQLEAVEPGTVYQTPDGEQTWEIEEVNVEYSVTVERPAASGSGKEVEHMNVPAQSLTSKLDYGDLKLVSSEEEEEEEDGGEHVCETCGNDFETQQGLAGHKPCEPDDSDDS